MPKPKTYFDQVPLEFVKKTANQENKDAGLSGESSGRQAGHYKYPEWERPFQEALLEFDSRRLKERVAAAEAKIFKRLHVISGSQNGLAERQAIADALSSLRVLKRDILKFPKECEK